jgi:hypothetical protein
MKKIKFSLFSIIISLISIVLITWLNYDLVQTYNFTDGKGRALFGIFESTYLIYKYMIGVIILVAIGTSVIGAIKRDNSISIYISFLLVTISILLIFLRLWKYFV